MTRDEKLANIRSNPSFSVVIVGAGINGVGTFRDLALQGVDVLLVDRADYCSGASSASSHMVHGGIRYLENGEFRLVREAVKERNRLLENAPHLVKPLATTIPLFKVASGILNAPLKFVGFNTKPSERGAFIIKAGLMMYDAYTRGQDTVPSHDFDSAAKSRKKFPKMNPDIISTATYYDAAMHSPERICVEVMRDGVASGTRAVALNYVSAMGATSTGLRLRDELTGQSLNVNADVVINAAGAWIDFANSAIGVKTQFIGGTKGSHIVLDHPELLEATKGNEIFFENDDGRIVLIYPMQDRVLVGTSDIKIDKPDQAVCTDEEIDYFFRLIKHVFPSIEVAREHIVFTFSGVRPLPYSEGAKAGNISRDHSLKVIKPSEARNYPILNLIGGKWTTFRAFSEKVADETLQRLGRTRTESTAALPIGGGKNFPKTQAEKDAFLQSLLEQYEVSAETLTIWLERYGTLSAEIAAFVDEQPIPDAPLTFNAKYTQHEVRYLMQREDVEHLDDLILRRSLMGMLGETSAELIVELADIAAVSLDWPTERVRMEIDRTIKLFADKHQVIL